MRNCIEMTRLISEGQDRPLTFTEKMEMSFHTMMCSGCRAFKSNSDKLRQLTRQHNQPDHPDNKPT